jgi:uncharacterized protein YciI
MTASQHAERGDRGYSRTMYVVLLNYTAPIEEIDYVLPDHVEWLARQYEHGHFLVSGRRNPRIGSVIIARPMSRGKLDAILGTDPFSIKHLAKYEVIEFVATKTAPELHFINEAVTNRA